VSGWYPVTESTTSRAAPLPSVDRCRVVELRRYALRPGQRDTLIELFDREFVETQEAAGMCVLGQFRDLDDPDSFVWLRGFSDMVTRRDALEAFYSGPVWREHARAANATMIDSDNVLLLRPIASLEPDRSSRAAPGTTVAPPGLLAVTIWPLASAAAEVPALFRRMLEPALREVGIGVLATYVTEHSENTFPSLPVREDKDVFVWMSLFEDETEHARRLRTLERSSAWRDVSQVLARHLAGAEELLRLVPTARSAIQG
jgi:quinol monooxygenase YgiN